MATPVRLLDQGCRPAILDHLLALSPDDRYGRFASTLTDHAIATYVTGMDLERDLGFGIAGRTGPGGPLAGFIHLARYGDIAELGASVLPACRRQGHARLLFAAALEEATRQGIREVHLATGHPAARHICRSLGYPFREGSGHPRVRVLLPRPAQPGLERPGAGTGRFGKHRPHRRGIMPPGQPRPTARKETT